MIFLINDDDVEDILDSKDIRKAKDRIDFFVLSTDIVTDGTYPRLEVAEPLIPDEMTLSNYINSDPEDAYKSYRKYIDRSEVAFISMLSIMMTLSNDRIPIIVSGNYEMNYFGFPQHLLKILRKRYEVETCVLKKKKDREVLIDRLYSKGGALKDSFDVDKYEKDIKAKEKTLLMDSPEQLISYMEDKSKKEIIKMIKPHLSKKDIAKIKDGDYKKKDLIKLFLSKIS